MQQRPPWMAAADNRSLVAKAKTKAPDQTFAEAHYLRELIEKQTPVTVRLLDGEEVSGVIEYFDVKFIRLTREGAPNLFVFKHEIKYLWES
ncbi:MAG: RNA chaperone Hfq [Bryobacteraceae bacterium]